MPSAAACQYLTRKKEMDYINDMCDYNEKMDAKGKLFEQDDIPLMAVDNENSVVITVRITKKQARYLFSCIDNDPPKSPNRYIGRIIDNYIHRNTNSNGI